jgi:hypothetical protein
MASIYKEIRAALETQLSGISGLPNIVFENQYYEAKTDTPYIVTRFVPTTRRVATLGPSHQNLYRGIFSIQVRYPLDHSGPSSLDDIIDTIVEGFPTDGVQLTASDTCVVVEYTEREQAFDDPSWYYSVVNVGWYAYK